jgi:hypothetical protein
MTLDGKMIDTSFCKGKLNAPKAMAILSDVLYVVDVVPIIASPTIAIQYLASYFDRISVLS